MESNSLDKIKCPKCTAFVFRKNLPKHLKKVHKITVDQIENEISAKENTSKVTRTYYKCNICGKKISKSSLGNHLVKKHEFQPISENTILASYTTIKTEYKRTRDNTKHIGSQMGLDESRIPEIAKEAINHFEQAKNKQRVYCELCHTYFPKKGYIDHFERRHSIDLTFYKQHPNIHGNSSSKTTFSRKVKETHDLYDTKLVVSGGLPSLGKKR